MTVQVTMPSVPGSRSNTVEGGGSNVGVEIGKDYENNVKRMYVVLAAARIMHSLLLVTCRTR